MLGKLIKHEFRATGRIMLPLYLVLLVTAIGANFAARGLLDTPFWFLDVLGGMLIIAFTFAIIGVCVVAFVLMIQRFYKNLLQDEGYVMLTLPVSVHQHIWAKLIVSAVWFVATVLAVILASCIMAFNIGIVKDIWQGLLEILWELRKVEAYYAFNGAAYLAELAAVCFLVLAVICLQFYAGLAIGHSFPRHKMVCSVAAFFALQFLVQLLGIGGMRAVLELNLNFHINASQLAARLAVIHIFMLAAILALLLYGAIFYFITAYFLKRRLNLE